MHPNDKYNKSNDELKTNLIKMKELIEKFRMVEHYIASLCDERIQGINFNPENHTWTIVNLIEKNQVFEDVEDLINFLKHKDNKQKLN